MTFECQDCLKNEFLHETPFLMKPDSFHQLGKYPNALICLKNTVTVLSQQTS